MELQALGMIETRGLVASIEFAVMLELSRLLLRQEAQLQKSLVKSSQFM